MSRRTVLLGCCLVVVAAALVLLGLTVSDSIADLRVYQTAGSAWWHGLPLYTRELPGPLPFTYPPAAAVVFSALAVVSFPVAIVLLTGASLIAMWTTTSLVAKVAPVLLMAAVLLEPVRETLLFGQVNLVLMGLVAFDCLAQKTRYPRGLLVGLAAAVKLTPAIFVVFFLLRRQYRAAATSAAAFVGGTVAAFMILPADSVKYWTSSVFDADRVGGAEFATNQSLRGALHRFGLAHGTEQVIWLLLAAAVLVLAWFGARRAAADPVVVLLVVAAAGLLVSPVSWSHHWVWIVAALAAGLARWPVLVFLVGQQLMPRGDGAELTWSWWQHLVGNSYLLVAVAFLVWCVVGEPRPDKRADSADVADVAGGGQVRAVSGGEQPVPGPALHR